MVTTPLDPKEIELIDHIQDNNLKKSLHEMRSVVDKIWAVEAPKLIKGYTDHGMMHCVNIVCKAAAILNANVGTPLSDEEMYLLLAGVYLHDVGMQCDLNNYPDIKSIAIQYGALINQPFANIADNLSLAEQEELRLNHHYLSAACIDHAYNNDNSLLGVAVKNIPLWLVDDLMDICMYHTKLDIHRCDLQGKVIITIRKQLVASILRFADELDIDAKRVCFDITKNFSMETNSKLYWWIHTYTAIQFPHPHIFIYVIFLHTEDAKQCKHIIYDLFIDSFRNKNKSVIKILQSNNITIHMSIDSGVSELKAVSKLPKEVIAFLNKRTTIPCERCTPLVNNLKRQLSKVKI